MKDFQIKLLIDERVPLVAQKERRIPFALRSRGKKDIQKLEESCIIEDVTGEPTP